jgi:molecular chaperone GrpE
MRDSNASIDATSPPRESEAQRDGDGLEANGLSFQELEEQTSRQQLRIEELQQEVASLTQESASLRDTVTDVRLRYREASEEFERAKLRIERESAAETEKERRTLLLPFLATMDDLERAIASAEALAPQKESQILDGLRLIHSNLLHTLAELDVRPMRALGRRFDAGVFDAVGTVETDDAESLGMVVDVVVPGYLMKDKVLRPAKVIVGKGPRVSEESGRGGDDQRAGDNGRT